MGIISFAKPAVIAFFKIVFAFLMAWYLTDVLMIIFIINPRIPIGLFSLSKILSTIFLVIAFSAILFTEQWKLTKYSLLAAIIFPIIIAVSSIVFEIPEIYSASFPISDMTCIIIISGCLGLFVIDYYTGIITQNPRELHELEINQDLSGANNDQSECIGAIELVEVPESHWNSQDSIETRESYIEISESIIRAMRLTDIPVGLRIECIDRKIRIFYLTWAVSNTKLAINLDQLENTLRVHLYGFNFRKHANFAGFQIKNKMRGVAAYLTGEPMSTEDSRQRINGLGKIVDALRTVENGIVQVFISPIRPSVVRRQLLKRQVRKEQKKAQATISKHHQSLLSGHSEQSFVQIDIDASSKLSEYERALRRHEASDTINVVVSGICWDKIELTAKRNVQLIMESLRSTILPVSKKNDFVIDISKGQSRFKQLLRGRPQGQGTLLIPEEASVYFILPRQDLGIVVASDKSFPSNPGSLKGARSHGNKEESIVLGHILDNQGKRGDEFLIPKDDLTTHIGIWGDIGKGKTTTAIKVLLDLWKLGTNFLVLLPSKSEDYNPLIRIIPNLRVFTPGNETVTPMRINPHEFAEGVTVNEIINLMKEVYVASFPSFGMIKEYVEAVIEVTFERLGWDRNTNKRGRSVLLSDFEASIPIVEKRELNYSQRGNEDFRGALKGRFRALLRGALKPVCETTKGMSVKELISAPTLILMPGLSSEEASLLTYLLTVNVAFYYEARKKVPGKRKKGLQFLIVLEEAHHFLGLGPAVQKDEGHAAQQISIEKIVQTMQEGRSSGLGFMILDQSPTRLSPGAVELPLTNIVHGKIDEANRILIGTKMNCSEDQIREIGSLPVGHAVIRAPDSAHPVRIEVISPSKQYPKLLSDENVTDEEIQNHMKPIYDKNPHFKEKESSKSDEHLSVYSPDSQETIDKDDSEIKQTSDTPSLNPPRFNDSELEEFFRKIPDSPAFAKTFFERLRQAPSGELDPIVHLFVELIQEFCPKDVNQQETGTWLFMHARSMLGAPEDTDLSDRIVSAIDEKLSESVG
jgi:hypothetical protein